MNRILADVVEFTDSLDPIKLYEYQAVGRPVVSTPVAGFRDADDPRVTVASGDAFAAAVVAAVPAASRFPEGADGPVADWSERDVWNYLIEHDVPYHPLHDRGYPSIGCTHCTKPVGPGGSPRAGRWAGLEKTECGIHI